MLRRFAVLILLIITSNVFIMSQNQFQLDIGLNGGISRLYHNTHFETTALYNAYEFVTISHPPGEYTWYDFVEDYGLRTEFTQPRFGFSAIASYGDIPLHLMTEAMSSSSSYKKMQIGVGGGIGKTFELLDGSYYA